LGNLIRDIIYLISAVALAAAVGIMGAVVFQEMGRTPAPVQTAAAPSRPQAEPHPDGTATRSGSGEELPGEKTTAQAPGTSDQTGPGETTGGAPQVLIKADLNDPERAQPAPEKPAAGDTSGREGSGPLASSSDSPAPEPASRDDGSKAAPDQAGPASGRPDEGQPLRNQPAPDEGRPVRTETDPVKPEGDSSPAPAGDEKPKPLPSSKTASKTDRARKPTGSSQEKSRPLQEKASEPAPEPADLLKTEALATPEENPGKGEEAPANLQAKAGADGEGVAGSGSDNRISDGRGSDDRVMVLAIAPILSMDETTLVRVDLSSEVEPTVKTFVNQKGQLKVSVDFPGAVRSGKVNSVIPSPSPLIKRIVVGDHQDKLRLVLDLDMSRNYIVQHRQDGRIFTLRVTPE